MLFELFVWDFKFYKNSTRTLSEQTPTRSLWPSRRHVRIIEKSINIDMNVRTLEVVTSSAWIMLEWLMLRSKEMKAGLSITHVIQTVKSVKFELIMKTSWFSLLAVLFMLEMKSRMITNSRMKRMRLGVCVVLRIAELEWISGVVMVIVWCVFVGTKKIIRGLNNNIH